MTTQLNDLTHRLTLLAAPHGYQVSARLLGGTRGNHLELKAARVSAGETLEYARHLTLEALELKGARTLATEFIREARVALSATAEAAAERSSRARKRKARR